MAKVAVVTGANKGIGFAIVKGLCERFQGVVYLTSRDDVRGKSAAAQLLKLNLKPLYHQLDVSNADSVRAFSEYIRREHGGIDVLINNAAIANADDLYSLDYDRSKKIIDINYRSMHAIEEYLYPLLRRGAKVVNISSDCGHLSNIRNKQWIETFTNKNFTAEDVDRFVDWFLDSVKNGTFDRNDLVDDASVGPYRISKVAMSALTIVQQKKYENRDIRINSMHPGLVRTDMTSGVGFFSAEQAAETALYLALEAPADMRGKYVWFDKRPLDWYDYNADYFFKCKTLTS